jgi:hypothetical protein
VLSSPLKEERTAATISIPSRKRQRNGKDGGPEVAKLLPRLGKLRAWVSFPCQGEAGESWKR